MFDCCEMFSGKRKSNLFSISVGHGAARAGGTGFIANEDESGETSCFVTH
jgi:hypothetical protein